MLFEMTANIKLLKAKSKSYESGNFQSDFVCRLELHKEHSASSVNWVGRLITVSTLIDVGFLIYLH